MQFANIKNEVNLEQCWRFECVICKYYDRNEYSGHVQKPLVKCTQYIMRASSTNKQKKKTIPYSNNFKPGTIRYNMIFGKTETGYF
jgi:hypothetical protein